jgi:hypothetical protein
MNLHSRVMGVHDMRAVSSPNNGMIAYVVGNHLIFRSFTEELQFVMGDKRGFSLQMGQQILDQSPIRLWQVDDYILFSQGGYHVLVTADGELTRHVPEAHSGQIRRWFSHRYQEMSRNILVSDRASDHVGVVADGHLYFTNETELAETGEVGATRVNISGYLGSGNVKVAMHSSGDLAAVSSGRYVLLVDRNGSIRNVGFGRGIGSAASMWFAPNGELVVADTQLMLWQRFKLQEPVAA